MKRAIATIVLAGALALPATLVALPGGPRVYSGPTVGVVLKANKNVVKSAGVGPPASGGGLPLQCDEGPTKAEKSFSFTSHPKVKHRKFRLKTSTTFVYQTIDDSGSVVATEKAPLTVTLRGKFNKAYSKVSGTVKLNGSSFGPTAGPNGSDVQYHNCSGTLQWTAHKGF